MFFVGLRKVGIDLDLLEEENRLRPFTNDSNWFLEGFLACSLVQHVTRSHKRTKYPCTS